MSQKNDMRNPNWDYWRIEWALADATLLELQRGVTINVDNIGDLIEQYRDAKFIVDTLSSFNRQAQLLELEANNYYSKGELVNSPIAHYMIDGHENGQRYSDNVDRRYRLFYAKSSLIPADLRETHHIDFHAERELRYACEHLFTVIYGQLLNIWQSAIDANPPEDKFRGFVSSPARFMENVRQSSGERSFQHVHDICWHITQAYYEDEGLVMAAKRIYNAHAVRCGHCEEHVILFPDNFGYDNCPKCKLTCLVDA